MAKKKKKYKLKPRSKLFPEPDMKEYPISQDLSELLKYQLYKSHILESRVFPRLEKDSEYDMAYRTVEYMKEAEISESLIYAFVKTGRLLSGANIEHLDEEDICEWNEAIDEYESIKETNKNLIEEALNKLPKEKQCPDITEKELKLLFESRSFHQILINKCKNTFIKNNVKESVVNGIIAVLNEIKETTGRVDLDGSALVDNVFSPNNPILSTTSYELGDDTEQQGIHFIFKGFVLAIRNQFLHRDIYLENPFIAIEYLSFLNFLLIILDCMELTNIEDCMELTNIE